MREEIFCFLYHSQIAANADISCVADIVKTARHFNKGHQITGMLVFDGQRFCQYIEGPKDKLQELIDRIAVDPRHCQFEAKHQGPVLAKRLFENWSMAYVLVDDSDPLDELGKLDGTDAIHKLEQLLPMLDIA